MKFKRILSVAALVGTALLLSGVQSRAAVVTLPTMLSNAVGNSFVVGDKTFNVLSAIGAGTQPPVLSAIQIGAQTVGPGSTIVAPFGFGLSGPIVSANSADGTAQSSDLALTYTVTAPAGSPITAVNLLGVGSAVGAGSAISIAETIINLANNQVIGTGTLVGSGTLTITLSQAATSIEVVKDILATSGPTAGSLANYSVVNQTFTQIPEPASIAMLGLGLVGIGGLSLRRRIRSV